MKLTHRKASLCTVLSLLVASAASAAPQGAAAPPGPRPIPGIGRAPKPGDPARPTKGVVPKAPAAPAEQTFLICQPGAPTLAEGDEAVIDRFLRWIEVDASLAKGSLRGKYVNKLDACEALLRGKQPATYLMPSLGLYLEHREKLNLRPMVQLQMAGATTQAFAVLTKQGGGATLDALKGKRLAGTPLAEPEVVRRLIFPQGFDAASHFKLEPATEALRTIKSVVAGELDAVLVDGVQARALVGAPWAAALQPVYTSEPLPLPPVCALGASADPLAVGRVATALSRMCADAEGGGAALCRTFNIEAFVPPSMSALEAAERRWGTPLSKPAGKKIETTELPNPQGGDPVKVPRWLVPEGIEGGHGGAEKPGTPPKGKTPKKAGRN